MIKQRSVVIHSIKLMFNLGSCINVGPIISSHKMLNISQISFTQVNKLEIARSWTAIDFNNSPGV